MGAVPANVAAAMLANAQADQAAVTAFQTSLANGTFTAVGLGQAIQALQGSLTDPGLIRGTQGLLDLLSIFNTRVNTLAALAAQNVTNA